MAADGVRSSSSSKDPQIHIERDSRLIKILFSQMHKCTITLSCEFKYYRVYISIIKSRDFESHPKRHPESGPLRPGRVKAKKKQAKKRLEKRLWTRGEPDASPKISAGGGSTGGREGEGIKGEKPG